MTVLADPLDMSGPAPAPPEWLTLEDGERVLLRVSPSRNLILAALAVGFVLLLAMSVFVSTMTDLRTGRVVSLAVLLLIVGLLVAAFLHIRRNEYVLTDEGVYTGTGLASKRVASAGHDEVSDVTVEQSSWQQLANVGTLRFVVDGGDLTFGFVDRPTYLYQDALEIVEEAD